MDPDRARLVTALLAQVQGLALASDQVSTLFAAQHQLKSSDFRALTAIHRAEQQGRPLTASQLAEELQLSGGAVTYLVDRLAASGHVVRAPDPDDRRRVLLRFAEHGRQVAAEFFGPVAQAHQAAMEAYSEEDLALCLRFLADVNESLAVLTTKNPFTD